MELPPGFSTRLLSSTTTVHCQIWNIANHRSGCLPRIHAGSYIGSSLDCLPRSHCRNSSPASQHFTATTQVHIPRHRLSTRESPSTSVFHLLPTSPTTHLTTSESFHPPLPTAPRFLQPIRHPRIDSTSSTTLTMLPDRYPSKYHPEGHRPKSRRELHDEVVDGMLIVRYDSLLCNRS